MRNRCMEDGEAPSCVSAQKAIKPKGKCKARMPLLIKPGVLHGPRTVRKLQW